MDDNSYYYTDDDDDLDDSRYNQIWKANKSYIIANTFGKKGITKGLINYGKNLILFYDKKINAVNNLLKSKQSDNKKTFIADVTIQDEQINKISDMVETDSLTKHINSETLQKMISGYYAKIGEESKEVMKKDYNDRNKTIKYILLIKEYEENKRKINEAIGGSVIDDEDDEDDKDEFNFYLSNEQKGGYIMDEVKSELSSKVNIVFSEYVNVVDDVSNIFKINSLLIYIIFQIQQAFKYPSIVHSEYFKTNELVNLFSSKLYRNELSGGTGKRYTPNAAPSGHALVVTEQGSAEAEADAKAENTENAENAKAENAENAENAKADANQGKEGKEGEEEDSEKAKADADAAEKAAQEKATAEEKAAQEKLITEIKEKQEEENKKAKEEADKKEERLNQIEEAFKEIMNSQTEYTKNDDSAGHLDNSYGTKIFNFVDNREGLTADEFDKILDLMEDNKDLIINEIDGQEQDGNARIGEQAFAKLKQKFIRQKEREAKKESKIRNEKESKERAAKQEANNIQMALDARKLKNSLQDIANTMEVAKQKEKYTQERSTQLTHKIEETAKILNSTRTIYHKMVLDIKDDQNRLQKNIKELQELQKTNADEITEEVREKDKITEEERKGKGKKEKLCDKVEDKYNTLLDNWVVSGNASDKKIFIRDYININYVKNNLYNFVEDCKKLDSVPEWRALISNLIVTYIVKYEKDPNSGAYINVIPSYNYFNLVLMGTPGVGKSYTADIVGRALKWSGFLTIGDRKDIKKPDIVGAYTGQTAPKVYNELTQCFGKTVFIDEAYSIAGPKDQVKGTFNEFGQESLDAITDFTSEHIGLLGFIVAGYEYEMRNQFLNVNVGLPRRFPTVLTLRRYNMKSFWKILEGYISKFALKEQVNHQHKACFELLNIMFNFQSDPDPLLKMSKDWRTLWQSYPLNNIIVNLELDKTHGSNDKVKIPLFQFINFKQALGDIENNPVTSKNVDVLLLKPFIQNYSLTTTTFVKAYLVYKFCDIRNGDLFRSQADNLTKFSQIILEDKIMNGSGKFKNDEDTLLNGNNDWIENLYFKLYFLKNPNSTQPITNIDYKFEKYTGEQVLSQGGFKHKLNRTTTKRKEKSKIKKFTKKSGNNKKKKSKKHKKRSNNKNTISNKYKVGGDPTKRGADREPKPEESPSEELKTAIQNSDFDKVKELVNSDLGLVNAQLNPNGTPILIAVDKAKEDGSKLEIVEFLLDKGADVNTEDTVDYTPLKAATMGTNLDLVKLLLDKGADTNKVIKNENGTMSQNPAIEELLKDPKNQNDDELTELIVDNQPHNSLDDIHTGQEEDEEEKKKEEEKKEEDAQEQQQQPPEDKKEEDKKEKEKKEREEAIKEQYKEEKDLVFTVLTNFNNLRNIDRVVEMYFKISNKEPDNSFKGFKSEYNRLLNEFMDQGLEANDRLNKFVYVYILLECYITAMSQKDKVIGAFDIDDWWFFSNEEFSSIAKEINIEQIMKDHYPVAPDTDAITANATPVDDDTSNTDNNTVADKLIKKADNKFGSDL